MTLVLSDTPHYRRVTLRVTHSKFHSFVYLFSSFISSIFLILALALIDSSIVSISFVHLSFAFSMFDYFFHHFSS